MEYTVDVATAGTYQIDARVASETTGGEVGALFRALDAGGVLVDTRDAGSVAFSATGGWQIWATETIGEVDLEAREYILRVNSIVSGFNLNHLSATLLSPTVTGVAVTDNGVVNLTFNETMGSGVTTPSNYTISGPGSGALDGSSPDTVVLSGVRAAETYILTWSGGGMTLGGDVTVSVSNVQNGAGYAIAPGTSATHLGGGVPVGLAAFSLE